MCLFKKIMCVKSTNQQINSLINLKKMLMKKTLTFKTLVLSLLLVILGNNLFAQTYNVPAGFPTVSAAVEAIKADASITAGSEVTINVAEGIYDEATIVQVGKAIKLTIQGAGADKTTLKGLESRPVPGETTSKRLFQLNNTSNNGFELIMKGIRFLNWGHGNANQGAVVLFGGAFTISVSLIDCEFEGIAARAGAVVQSNNVLHSVHIENCFIHNCVTFDNDNLKGLLNFAGTGKITIINSTFMSNEQYVLNKGSIDTGTDRKLREGLIITIGQGGGNPQVTIENNVFVNNKVVDAGSTESAKPMISIVTNPENENPNHVIGMKNNVFVGNGRAGDNKDVDLYYNDVTNSKLIFENPQGNILNSFIKLENEAYAPVEHEGFLVDASYTYNDPRIDFVMEGELPKIHYDDKGVGYLVYNGNGTGGQTSVSELSSNKLEMFSLNGVVTIRGLSAGNPVEVFSVTGSLITRLTADSEQISINLPKGVFVIRSGVKVGKVLVY
jgi:hypothetical protein